MSTEKRLRATIAFSIMLLVLAVAYYLQADALPRSRLAGQVGADGFPKMLAVALGLLSAGLAVQSFLEIRKQRRLGASASDHARIGWKTHLRALGLIGIGAVYILVLPYLGYAVSVALVLAGVATYTGLKPSWKTALFTVGGAAVFHAIFVSILGIRLPSGFWPTLFG